MLSVVAIPGMVASAAMQDADEAVADGAQGLGGEVAGGAVLIVEGPGAGLLVIAQNADWSIARRSGGCAADRAHVVVAR